MNFYTGRLLTAIELKFDGMIATLPEAIEAIKEETGTECWSKELYLRVYVAYLDKIISQEEVTSFTLADVALTRLRGLLRSKLPPNSITPVGRENAKGLVRQFPLIPKHDHPLASLGERITKEREKSTYRSAKPTPFL
jgi:hypothetical protein